MNEELDHTEPVKPAKPPYQPLRRLKRLGVLFAILFGIWVMVAYVLPYLMGVNVPPTSPPTSIQVSADPVLAGRIEALEARIKTLEETQVAPKPAEAAADTRVDELSQKMTSQEGLLAEMKKTVDDSTRQLGAMVAFDQLKTAALRGENFRDQLRRLTTLTQGRGDIVPLLAKLMPYAENGLTTLEELQLSFGAAIPRALEPGASSWGSTMHSLIRVRKIGEEQQGTDDESVIARAEAALARGNVGTTVKELSKLSPPAADALTAWNTQAKQYDEAQDALDALQFALFSAPSTPTP